MDKTPEMYAKEYLESKKSLLEQCVLLTVDVGKQLGNIPETHRILGQRKQTLTAITQLDQQYAAVLSEYAFTPEDLEPLSLLAEKMWEVDDRITEAMRNNKTDIQDFLNTINIEYLRK